MRAERTQSEKWLTTQQNNYQIENNQYIMCQSLSTLRLSDIIHQSAQTCIQKGKIVRKIVRQVVN